MEAQNGAEDGDMGHLEQVLLKRNDNYAPVERAIDFLVANFESSPSLEETAAHVGLSPAHFQRIFTEGAGISPKRFLQFLAAGKAKRALLRGENVLEAAYSAGLSGPSRLHDLFLVAEATTPGAWRRKGEGETIRHAFVSGPFGETLIGATDRGVSWLSFAGGVSRERAIEEMRADWSAARFFQDEDFVRPFAARAFAFACGRRLQRPLALHVQGTNFQLKVWEALLRIPFGATTTYGDLACHIGAKGAARAVGAAVGANMVSLLIPCHRVILSSGAVHSYRWGAPRKKAILALEQALAHSE